MDPHNNDAPLWRPSAEAIATANLTAFIEAVETDWHVVIDDYAALHAFSVAHPARFWTSLKDFAGLYGESWGTEALTAGDKMPGATWFPDARLNYAQNLLRRNDDSDAIVFWGEDRVKRRITRRELYQTVARTADALKRAGVGPGDRVAGMVPNTIEAVVAMLATASIGAVWSSCSPDFGAPGVLDRFGQIGPKVLFAVDGYFYNGKIIDCREKVATIIKGLASVTHVVITSYALADAELDSIDHAVRFEDFIHDAPQDIEIDFFQAPFNHPLFIMFSSGTTGVPKCIVHSAGGTLLQHVKEHALHCDIKPGDRVMYFTTCGWMMWNWLVSALASDATLLLYDGSPFYPGPEILFDYADVEGMTFFGTSAKYIDALAKADARPRDTHALKTLRAMASTGSPLVAESFDYVYGAIKQDLHLASISGGTDIISCFILGCPVLPVWRGEIQTAGLGMAVDVFGDDGHSIQGEKGEMVCTQPFPSMPIGFWNDADGARYHAAYFERFANVWTHGDFIERTRHGGFVVYGRSDATLNPGGVRIGTAEIYRQAEQLDEILESIAIGQEWDGDVRVVLFVRLRDGLQLDAELIKRIQSQIRQNCSPRHVPARVVQVNDIPRTKSGKITELAVRDVVHGREVKNTDALANPQALDEFRNRVELQS